MTACKKLLITSAKGLTNICNGITHKISYSSKSVTETPLETFSSGVPSPNTTGVKPYINPAFTVFPKITHDPHYIENYSLKLKECIKNAKNTGDKGVIFSQFYAADTYFKRMCEAKVELHEDIYGQLITLLIEKRMVKEFENVCEVIQHNYPTVVARLAYYKMLLWVGLGDEKKIAEACDYIATTEDVDETNTRENYFLALCERDQREEVLALAATIDIKRISSMMDLTIIFQSLARYSLESLANKFLLELKGTLCLFCDAINAGNCKFAYSEAMKKMYGSKDAEFSFALMPIGDDTWSVMQSWALPTKSFLEFVMFSRIFVDMLDAQFYEEHHQTGHCRLSLSKDKHCYSRVLELLVNVWAFHSARKMVYVNPESGGMQEQHKLKGRRGKMWIKWFSFPVLKSMDEDLAEECDSENPRKRWLWPNTCEVFWQGMSERERHMRNKEKEENKRKRKEKIDRMSKRHGQKTIGKYIKPPHEELGLNSTEAKVLR